VAALDTVASHQSLLQGRQLVRKFQVLQAFHSDYVASVRLKDFEQTGVEGAVGEGLVLWTPEQHRAGSAGALAASHLGAGEALYLAQKMGQGQKGVVAPDGYRFSIEKEK